MSDGRLLTCTRCGERIRVYELPRPFIEPALYVGCVCGCSCLPGESRPQEYEQPTLFEAAGLLEETREYDPTIAAIPF